MGIFDKLAGWLSAEPQVAASAVTPTSIRSPFAGALAKVALADLFGTDVALPVSRAEAMSVPAIARGRHILVSDAARCPLQVLDLEGPVAGASPWLTSTNLTTSPQHRAVWTTDDLIHFGWSLWTVKRDDDGTILDGARVPIEWWRFDTDNRILVKDQPAEAESTLLIPGYHEGIVNSGHHTIRGARRLEVLWQNRAANPIPAVELHQNTAEELSDEEIRAVVEDWQLALAEAGGTVAWTPKSLDVKVHGEGSSDLLIQGRNAAAIDAARLVGVPAAMVDASNVNSTLTYETLEGRGGEYADRSLPLYLGPVESRLSLDDVTAEGTRVRADTSALRALTPPTTGTPTGD